MRLIYTGKDIIPSDGDLLYNLKGTVLIGVTANDVRLIWGSFSPMQTSTEP